MHKIESLKQEFTSSSKELKRFIIFSMLSVFAISIEYAITRPASNSFFITHFGAKYFPLAWLLSVPLNFMVIYLYNHFLPKMGSLKIFLFTIFFTIALNSLCFVFIQTNPSLCFLQYMFKDIYILLMFKQIWSFVHLNIPKEKAKYLYALIYAMGGVGATLGGFLPWFYASFLGTKALFIFTLPIYAILAYFYFGAYKNCQNKLCYKENEPKGKYGFFQKKGSNHLLLILCIVLLMQVSIAFVEFQFNLDLQKYVTNLDLRTEYTGKIFTIIHIMMMTFQIFGSFLVLHFFGLEKTHYILPMTIFVCILLYMLFPSFYMASFFLIYIKTLDYSIFGIAREMLYMPLKADEKYRTKAFIDVFVHRSSKALASFFLFFVVISNVNLLISYTLVSIIIIWLVVIRVLFRNYQYIYQNI